MTRQLLFAATALTLALPAVARTAARAPRLDSAAISGLGIRNIGSAAMSGRIAAIAARQEPDGAVTIFVGAASGGVWKSDDAGTTFRPVFDKQPVQSIGALALDPTNPQVVWAGTGEGWTRNSVSIGNGVYKSTDGGVTWANMGLPRTERITRIAVDPRNGNTVYVCAPGPLWSDSADRGLYKTTDGGAHWSQILTGANLSTGCSSIALDPSNPDRLIAGLWDFRRKGWTFRSGGDGPAAPSGSAMLTSTDGGRHWQPMTAANTKGLPAGPWGRIEVVFAPSKPSRVYAFVENTRSALYVSDDGGRSFEARDRSRNMVWRPFYFSRMVVDPKNADRVFKMNLRMIVSEDGGRSFADTAGGSHGDWHDIWINPANPKMVIGGDDGGFWVSHDGGSKWWKGYNLPISQFYHVSTDNKDPFQVYGGLQDNSSWVADSAYPGGVTNNRWENIGNGDGMWAFSDPADPNYAYTEFQGGTIIRINRKTLEQRDIQPKGGYKEKLRFNWNTPIALSPHEKGTIYIGSQFLFRSRDHGQTWDRISPDLTTNNPEQQKQEESGGITVDNSAAETHTTIYSVSESPRVPGTIWIGTDDGNVQLTRDGGANWRNLTANLKLPQGEWINWVEASRHDPATAYVVVDRHSLGDFAPYLFVTRDYGATWRRLIGPATPGVTGYAYVVREDRLDPRVLFVGTELGLFVSNDAGRSWAQFKPNNFPAVSVRDLAIQDRDDAMAVATHGRGIWIVDDIAPLRALTPATLAANAVLIPAAPVQQRIEGNGGWPEGDATFSGENPPDGAVITYYQKARHVIGRMKLEVLDANGKLVEELPASKRKGLNRVVWSMREKPPLVPPAASIAGRSTQGPRVLPGTYMLRLTKAGKVSTVPLVVGLDHRATYTLDDRRAQYEAAERVKGLYARMSALVAGINSIRAQSDAVAGRSSASPQLRSQATSLSARADMLRRQLVATKEGGAITGEERLRENMDYAYGAVTSTEARPTPYALARIDALERELKEVENEFAALKASDASRLNTALRTANMPPIELAAIVVDPAGATGGPAAALARGLLGTRFLGDIGDLAATGEKD